MKTAGNLSAGTLACVCRLRRGGIIVNEHILSREATRLHVETLAPYFDFIGLNDLCERLSRPGRRPFCLLTFDDGKRSNATVVAPQLLKLGVPAVFYLSTDNVTQGTPFWFDRHRALLRVLRREPDGLEERVVKQLPFDELMRRLDRACAQHGIEPDLTNDDLRPMSWDEARRLARDRFALGAHGLRHAILTNESTAVANDEIRSSIAKVRQEIGSCDTFAFPNGNYTRDLARCVLDCGARSVMVTDPTWVGRGCPAWRLPRIQLFPRFSAARIQLKLAAAAFAGVLANPDGTGRRYAIKRWASARDENSGTGFSLPLGNEGRSGNR